MTVDQLLYYHDIPDKLYFKIGEVAELAGIPSYVLRFWEAEFACIRPKRTESGQRLYRKSDVETILTIKHLLHEKRFTIEGAKQHLRCENQSKGIAESPETEYIEEPRYQPATEYKIKPTVADTTYNDGFAVADTDKENLLKEIYLDLQYIHDLLKG